VIFLLVHGRQILPTRGGEWQQDRGQLLVSDFCVEERPVMLLCLLPKSISVVGRTVQKARLGSYAAHAVDRLSCALPDIDYCPHHANLLSAANHAQRQPPPANRTFLF